MAVRDAALRVAGALTSQIGAPADQDDHTAANAGDAPQRGLPMN